MPKGIERIAAAHGFEVVSETPLPEIDGDAIEMVHAKSRARLLYLRNDDDDKAFSISFKTPAADDTGVFHILEHSVLCGSERFPVKEPFVNLLKSSMQTFLNAMTFPDKTMYPVASTNEQDLINLMDVYLDAVFHPNIYENPMIFEQEGWHIEPASDEADESGFEYNGVVFNEMKGALSSSESVLYDTLSAALFPDTTYRFESGGVPIAIPDLTYEAFLDAHRRHYRPDNSYIVLYGNLDADRFLGFLDDRYLARFDMASLGELETNPLELQAPVERFGIVQPMDTSPDSSCMALGHVIGVASEVERIMAVDILLDAIMGSNEAPLKRALLDAGIAEDVKAYVADSMAQPFALIQARGLADDAAERFPSLVRETIERLAAGGLDDAIIEAALAHAEFVMREHSFGYPDGVILAMSAMSGWLYSDAGALDYLRYEDVYASLRARLSTDWFRELLREVFLENPHQASARIEPVEHDEKPMHAALQARLEGMGAEALADARAHAIALKEAQAAPDAPEDVARLPRLSLADIGEAPAEAGFFLEEGFGEGTLVHEVETHGIVYATRYFDVSCVPFDDIPYLSLLAKVLGKLDCAETSAADMDTLVQSKLGNLSFGIEVYEDPFERDRISPRFVVEASALAENASFIASLANEIVQDSLFHDYDRLHDILLQRKVAFEQSFAMAGQSVAAARAATYYLPAAVLRDQIGGIECYRFTKALLEGFDERKEAVADKLAELAALVFADDGCLLSFAGPSAALDGLMEAGLPLGMRSEPAPARLVIPEPVPAREAFIVPTDISYTALSADRKDVAPVFDGAWSVLARILSFDYLWNEVRVLGGAYGCGFSSALAGASYFYSYRDPRIDETVERFEHAGAWLARFEPSEEELTGYIVSTVGSIDNPLKPRELVKRQDTMHMTGYSRADRLRARSEAMATTAARIRALGADITRLSDEGHLCCVGARELIEASTLGFETIELC